MKPISIALVHADPGYGGGHVHVLDLAKNLSNKFQPTIMAASRELIQFAKKEGISTATIPTSRFAGFEDIKPLRRLLIKHKFDLIHAHGPRAGFATSLATLRLKTENLKLVYTDHAWNPDYKISPVNALLQMVGLRLVARAADKVIAVSQASRDFLVGRGIVKAEKTIIIPNGIRLSNEGRRLKTENKQPATSNQQPIVGSVGVFNHRKGHDVFVRAMPLVIDEEPSARFAIIGDGEEKINIEKLAVQLGVRRFLHLPGRISDQERDKERQRWIIYVQSSRDESFGIAAAEALAQGLPVVAARVGGLPDVVDGGGLIVDKEDPAALATAIIRLLESKALRERLAKTGQAHVYKNFDLKKVVSEIEKVYLSLIPRQTSHSSSKVTP